MANSSDIPSALPFRTVLLAVVGLVGGFVLFGNLSPNLYAPYLPHRVEFFLWIVSIAVLAVLFNQTRRLPWWIAPPLFAGTAFLFLVTFPVR